MNWPVAIFVVGSLVVTGAAAWFVKITLDAIGRAVRWGGHHG